MQTGKQGKKRLQGLERTIANALLSGSDILRDLGKGIP
jgi:hypothetical protein